MRPGAASVKTSGYPVIFVSCKRVSLKCFHHKIGNHRMHPSPVPIVAFCVTRRYNVKAKRVPAGCQRVHAGCQAYLWCGVGPSVQCVHSLCVAAEQGAVYMRVRVCSIIIREVENFVVAYLEFTYNITVCAARAPGYRKISPCVETTRSARNKLTSLPLAYESQ